MHRLNHSLGNCGHMRPYDRLGHDGEYSHIDISFAGMSCMITRGQRKVVLPSMKAYKTSSNPIIGVFSIVMICFLI